MRCLAVTAASLLGRNVGALVLRDAVGVPVTLSQVSSRG